MFSYKAQVDDAMEEDTVSLPHQQSFSSLKTDSDYIYQVHVPSFHLPFHDSQIARASSAAKQTSSLYSLTPRKDLKSANTSRYSSQVTLYGTSPGAKSKRLMARQSNPDFGKYTLLSSGTLGGPQKSAPNLNLEVPSWKTRSVSLIRPGDGGLSSILSPTSHSHFAYRSRFTESATHFLSESSKSSLESEPSTVKEQSSKSIPEDKEEAKSSVTKSSEKSSPLESSLQNLLSGKTHELKRKIDPVNKEAISDRLLGDTYSDSEN